MYDFVHVIFDAVVVCSSRVGMELALSDTALVFARLVELLSACAPNKLAYRKGVAIRENEEAALIIQSAVPIQGTASVRAAMRRSLCIIHTGVVSALLSVSSWWMKAVLLRFLEQVWGTLPLSITPAVSVVDLTPATRLTPKPATAMSPIVIHLFEVKASCSQLLFVRYVTLS